ncbi:hypothetical protein DFH09DRAFT_346069 [Mycena vulgaris]|nr:hypothetical protein DFH09DRAFT_346069 [Mycena vulgaris]
MHCLPVSELPGGPPSYDANSSKVLEDPPILLTRICRDWRVIALSTPHLWSHVCLGFGGKPGLRDQSGFIDSWWVSFLESWLSRAKTQPLSMMVSNPKRDPNGALAGLLDGYRQQWRDMTLKLPFNIFQQFSTAASIPILQHLALDASNVPRTVDDPIAAFQHAPMLTDLRLGRWLRPSNLILPWVQLTSLELASATSQDCVECLGHTPRLVNCVLEILEGPRTSPSPPSTHSLLHLRSLTLTGASPSAIFPCVVMPALEELDIAGRSLNSSDLSSAQFFVSRSGCQLRRLRLHYVSEILTTPAIQLLEALPSLDNVELAVTEAKTITALFLRLKDSSGLFPQLQNISISHHKVHDSNLHEMFRVVTDVLARRETPSPEHVRLASFSLLMQHEDTPPRLGTRQRWQELVARGMKLSVKSRRASWI